MINSTQIKPLVLEKVVVKAKRSKDKEQVAGSVEMPEMEDNEIFEPEQ